MLESISDTLKKFGLPQKGTVKQIYKKTSLNTCDDNSTLYYLLDHQKKVVSSVMKIKIDGNTESQV